MSAAGPARVSLLFTPAALILALGFVIAFYWAAVPLSSLRAENNWLPGLILAFCGAGIPVAGFIRNRQFFADPRAPGRTRGAALLVAESATLLFILLVFANATAGGDKEAALLGRINALTIEASELRKQVDRHAQRRGSLTDAGKESDLAGIAHRGESFIGRDGTIILYDSDLRACSNDSGTARRRDRLAVLRHAGKGVSASLARAAGEQLHAGRFGRPGRALAGPAPDCRGTSAADIGTRERTGFCRRRGERR